MSENSTIEWPRGRGGARQWLSWNEKTSEDDCTGIVVLYGRQGGGWKFKFMLDSDSRISDLFETEEQCKAAAEALIRAFKGMWPTRDLGS